MATFRKRGDKYRAEIVKNGVRKSKSFRTKAEAMAWAVDEERKIAILASGGQIETVFADVIRRYQKEVSVTKRTGKHEISRLERLLQEPIANLYVADIRREDVEAWIAERLNSGLQEASVRRELNILSNIFTMALTRWNYIVKNPMVGVALPKNSTPRTQRFSQAEIDLLIEHSGYLRDLKRPRARVGSALLFAIETGMRAGEICALTWDNVFFDRRIAHLPMTKNGTARDVPLSSEAMRILRQLEEMKCEDRVFQLSVKSLSSLFIKLKQVANLDHLNFHDTRREALTRLAKKVDVLTLAKISGHKDIKILSSTYYAPNMSEVASLLD